MAAAWSFSRGAPHPITRVVSALSLDGHRLASEITVQFLRPLAPDTAESIADEVARATSEVLGEQIAQGKVPLSRSELLRLVTDRTTATVGKVAEVRVTALHLIPTETLHSTHRARASIFPPSTPVPQVIPPTSSRTLPPPATSTLPLSAPPASTTPASTPPASRPPASRSPVSPTSAPAAFTAPPAPTAPVLPPASTGLSGQHVISTPRGVRTLWRTALIGAHPAADAAHLGELLGPALRDSAASILLRAATVVEPSAVDRLSLFDATHPSMPQLRREACACFLSALYRVFVSSRVDRESLGVLLEATGREAVRPEPVPRREIARYAASESPVRDLAQQVATLIGSPHDALEIHNAILPYCEHLRADLWHVAHEVRRLRGIP